MPLRQPALAFAEIAQAGPRALYHRPRRWQSTTTGVNRRVPSPFLLALGYPGPVLVAKNLHLTNFLLIFHGDTAETASAVPDVDMSDNALALNDDTANPAARDAGRQPALTGCPWHDVNEMLQAAGLRALQRRFLAAGSALRHFSSNNSTVWEELPQQVVMLIYVSTQNGGPMYE